MMRDSTRADAASKALRKREMAALPVFVHVAAVADNGGAASSALECAVCLAEMRDGERGRLLPRCGHRFHVECIDRWFRANFTCPICRAAAVGVHKPSSSSYSSSLLDGDLRFDLYAVLVALGLVSFLAVCFWRLYRLTVSARPQDMLPVVAATLPPCAGAEGKAALRQKDVAALPVFVHGGDEAAAVECAVCLAEMEDGERGRLLPACGHRFHVDCIDRWFRANSTCPVCRAAAVGHHPADAVEACKGGSPQVMVAVRS
ncbi:hypothetical protein BAE44_0008168 [Dichanthelium oligosanthes]|uniref:RING-type domain-containing protein n=1 Tax=Dichanthelium oligosanthes TaxID=888268 RepID=A0A1E5W0A7_9POAL|nr:hypothetical protein BAE44_0008168 [Dichanthelium oligosanthes]